MHRRTFRNIVWAGAFCGTAVAGLFALYPYLTGHWPDDVVLILCAFPGSILTLAHSIDPLTNLIILLFSIALNGAIYAIVVAAAAGVVAKIRGGFINHAPSKA